MMRKFCHCPFTTRWMIFEGHPVIAPKRDGRERALDLPSAVFSQDAVLAGGDLNNAPTTPIGLPPG